MGSGIAVVAKAGLIILNIFWASLEMAPIAAFVFGFLVGVFH